MGIGDYVRVGGGKAGLSIKCSGFTTPTCGDCACLGYFTHTVSLTLSTQKNNVNVDEYCQIVRLNYPEKTLDGLIFHL